MGFNLKVFLVFSVLSLSALLSSACDKLGDVCAFKSCCNPYKCTYDAKISNSFCSCAREGQKCGSGRIGSAAGCCAESTCQDGICKKRGGTNGYVCAPTITVDGKKKNLHETSNPYDSDDIFCQYDTGGGGGGQTINGCLYNSKSGKLTDGSEMGYKNYKSCPEQITRND